MFAQLGDHIFQGLKTPTSSNESDAVMYGQIPRINNKPQIQPTGAELREISLAIMFSVDFCEPSDEIKALKRSMHNYEVLPYITGDGLIVGKFVITNIETAHLQCRADGRVEMAAVNINLLEYSDSEDPQPTGQALASQKPITETPAAPAFSPASEITSDIADAKNKVSGMKQTIAKVKTHTISFKRGVRDVRQLATDAQTAYITAKAKIAVTKKIVQRASQLPTSLDEAIKYAENLAKMDNVADISVLEINVTQLSNSADKVTSSAAPAVGFVGTKEGGE